MRVACQLADILTAAKLKLVTAGVCTDTQAFMTLEPELLLEQPPNPPLYSFSFDGFNQFPTTLSCEDTVATESTMQGDLIISIWLRMALEQQGRDAKMLTDASRGVSELVRQVQAVFNNEVLVNPDGDEITWRQLIYMDYRNKGRWKDAQWRRIDVRFDCCYEADPVREPDAANSLNYSDSAGDELVYSASAADVLVWG